MRIGLEVPARAAFARALRGPVASAVRTAPLRDPTPDAGLFGPGSVTWRVMAEPALMLGAARALLMQAAHPLVAQGAIEHSTYESDPYGRLERTVRWVTLVCFGTRAEAERASRGVNALHRSVAGTLPRANATPCVSAGTPYSGTDPRLLRWVHASFVDTMLVAHDALVGGLDREARDTFVLEWNVVAALMEVPRRLHFRSHRQLEAYVARQLGSVATPGKGSRRVAETVLHPPGTSRMARPGAEALAFISAGLLPAQLRSGYGIAWTPIHQLAHGAACRWLRSIRPGLPRRFKVSPIHDLALARSAGRWPIRPAA